MILADISIPPHFLLKLNLSVRRVGLTKTKTNTLSLRGLFWLQIWFMHSHNQVITVNRSAFFCFFLFFKTHFLPLTCFFVMASLSLSSPRFPPPSSSFAAVKPLFCFSLSLPISASPYSSAVSSVPSTLLQHLWHLSILHYFCCSPASPSHLCTLRLVPSSSRSYPDIDLHSSHTAEPPVALQWAHISLLLLCVYECARRKGSSSKALHVSVSWQS